MAQLEINFMDDPDTWYVFEDVAELLWPGDYDYSNHTAEERVQERLIAKGATKTTVPHSNPEVKWRPTMYVLPNGAYVGFDSESGCFECHSSDRSGVQYVVDTINEMLVERDRMRKALA